MMVIVTDDDNEMNIDDKDIQLIMMMIQTDNDYEMLRAMNLFHLKILSNL